MPLIRTLEEDEYIFQCSKPTCDFRVVARHGRSLAHKCPYPLLSVKVSWMAYGPTLLEQLWTEADRLTDIIMDDPDDEKKRDARSRLGGVAFALKLYMNPHLTTIKQVGLECQRRREARINGDTEYETPGLRGRRFDPPPGESKLYDLNLRSKAALAVKMDEAKQQQIRDWRAKGATPRELATMFQVSESTIGQVLKGQPVS